MVYRPILSFVSAALSKWREDRASLMAAALAYYTVFSIAPLVVILVAIAGSVLDRDSVQLYLADAARERFGEEAVLLLRSLTDSMARRSATIVASSVGTLLLLYGATRIFAQLREAFDVIWKAPPSVHRGFVSALRNRLVAMLSVIVAGLLLMAMLLVKTLEVVSARIISGYLPQFHLLWEYAEAAASIVVLFAIFALVFKALPGVRVAWRDVWLGSLITSLLFMAGRLLFGTYLGSDAFTSIYGAASSIFLLLLWFYFLAAILLLGAICSYVHATTFGSHERPVDDVPSALQDSEPPV
ncbi:MAG: YihY/virulence factor BrkB family protein [Candidatus Latescibacteria bacterium]|jgi:membrane protein|nr:YihY/virulence factor BrkB family protein [Candidatus Latescibacterota bacterium]